MVHRPHEIPAQLGTSADGSQGQNDRVVMAIYSKSFSVLPALISVFSPDEIERGVFLIRESRLEMLRDLVSSLSWLDSRSLRASLFNPEGRYDPWEAMPIEQVLERLDTPWYEQVIRRETIDFHYQPIVHAIKGEVFANEMLIRAKAGDQSLSPAELIDAAKAHDNLVGLDQLCRGLTIKRAASYLKGGDRAFINFFPIAVYDPEVCLGMTFGIAERQGVNLSQLWMELVESEAFPDLDHLRRIVDYIRERGAKVVLDDVGSGNTAILYIDKLEPDVIKIDREVLYRAVQTGASSIFIGLVRYAQERGIITIAEGVETMKELDFCRELGVDYVQGYLIARPKAVPLTGVIPSESSEAA